MNKIMLAIAVLAMSLNAAVAEEKEWRPTPITAIVEIGETMKITPQKSPIFGDVLDRLSIKDGESSPPSIIISGKIVDNNAGGAKEFVPVFFGSTLHLPRLAAISNVKGEFSFRVWIIKELPENASFRLFMANANQSALYLGGRVNEDFQMLTSRTDIYNMIAFSEETPPQKK